MGLFGFGKKKNKDKSSKGNSKNKKSKKVEIKAPILFEDDEKFSKIMSNIKFFDSYSDFGVQVNETLGEILNSKVVSDNRVRLFLGLKNYHTDDLIFKASESSSGITGKQYKLDVAEYKKQLNCKFISQIDQEVEVGRLYCLDLYSKDYIEFWKVLQMTALLGNRTDEVNLKYMAIMDRLEQSLSAVDVSRECICNSLKSVIISSYNLKMKDEVRVKYQLQRFIEAVSLDYEISEDTWLVIYKYLNGIVASGFKLKLDSLGIELGYGFTVEVPEIKKIEKEVPNTIADMDKVLQKGRTLGEEDKSEEKKNTSNILSDVEDKSSFGNTLELDDDDNDVSVSKDYSYLDDLENSLKDEIVGFDDYQRNLSAEDNTSGFKFDRVDGDELVGKSPVICIKMSDMMKSYFKGDAFNAVVRQIYNLNTALNSSYGINNCVVQLCSSYNPLDIESNQLDDLIETLCSDDIGLVDFHFTNVLSVIEDVLGTSRGRVIFIIYDRIIDKTTSIRKMREMHELFENNKFIFIQLDEDVENNFSDLRSKEESLFTNCRHILAKKDLISSSMSLANELRNAFLE